MSAAANTQTNAARGATRRDGAASLPSSAMELRRRHLDRRARALRQAEAIAFFFPAVRPRGPGADALVKRLADADADTLDDACDNLPDEERRRIVDSWTSRHPERWAVLVGEARDVRLAERALVVGALRGAAGDSRPCDPAELAEIEAAPAVHPGNALAAVIQPATVWEYELAVEAAAAAGTRDRERAIAAIGFRYFARCRQPLLARVAWVASNSRSGRFREPRRPSATGATSSPRSRVSALSSPAPCSRATSDCLRTAFPRVTSLDRTDVR